MLKRAEHVQKLVAGGLSLGNAGVGRKAGMLQRRKGLLWQRQFFLG